MSMKHLRIEPHGYGHVQLVCRRCGADFELGQGSTFAMVRAVMAAFEADHEDCEPPPPKPPPTPMPPKERVNGDGLTGEDDIPF